MRYKPGRPCIHPRPPTKPICLLITGTHTCQFIRRQKTTRSRACTWQWESRKARFHAINEYRRQRRRRRRDRYGLIRLYDVFFCSPLSLLFLVRFLCCSLLLSLSTPFLFSPRQATYSLPNRFSPFLAVNPVTALLHKTIPVFSSLPPLQRSQFIRVEIHCREKKSI